jgi:formate/nitrite transporter FocA (FNT family)
MGGCPYLCFQPEVRQAFADLGREAVSVTFGTAILRGIFAGWLIAMVGWLMAACDTGKIAIIVALTYIVGLARLTHVVVGSVEALYTVMIGETAWLRYLVDYMLPTLLGNIIGGVSLVSALNSIRAQPRPGDFATPPDCLISPSPCAAA